MKSTLQQIKIVALGVILAAGLSYALAWTGPSSTPPNGNVAAPLNVGTSTQTKYGNLVLNGLSVSAATILSGVLQIPIGTPAANNVLVSSDASGTVAWVSTSTLGFGGSSSVNHGMQDFDSSGTWTAPAGVTSVMVEAWGGGSGASGNSGSADVNGTGGAYGKSILSVTPGTTYTITVGAGGLGTQSQTIPAGGNSSFSSLMLVPGGDSATSPVGLSVYSPNISQNPNSPNGGLGSPNGGLSSSGGPSATLNGSAPGGGGVFYYFSAGNQHANYLGNGASGRVVVSW